MKWVDKKKGLAYLSSASHYVQQEIDKQNLSSAAKIINGFGNPVIKDENLSREGESPYPDRSHPFCICATPFIGGKIQSYMRDAIDHNILINRTIILQDWLIRTIVS